MAPIFVNTDNCKLLCWRLKDMHLEAFPPQKSSSFKSTCTSAKPIYHVHTQSERQHPPSSISVIALALASSSAVTHLCLSTSELAFRWKVWVPPLEITKLHDSSVWMKALAKLMVPRQVCDISAWFLQQVNITVSIKNTLNFMSLKKSPIHYYYSALKCTSLGTVICKHTYLC